MDDLHLIQFTDYGWTIAHPISERLNLVSLFECEMRWDGGDPELEGVFELIDSKTIGYEIHLGEASPSRCRICESSDRWPPLVEHELSGAVIEMLPCPGAFHDATAPPAGDLRPRRREIDDTTRQEVEVLVERLRDGWLEETDRVAELLAAAYLGRTET